MLVDNRVYGTRAHTREAMRIIVFRTYAGSSHPYRNIVVCDGEK